MKRIVILFMTLLFLTGCGTEVYQSDKEMEQPVRFYYCTNMSQTHTQTDAMTWEYRDLGKEKWSVSEILQLYLKGPKNPALVSPFPDDVIINSVILSDGLLTLNVDPSVKDITGIQRTLAVACIVQTMTQLHDIRAVRFLCDGQELSDGWSGPWTAEDFLYEDDTATGDTTTVKVYYSDGQGRYLKEQTCSGTFASEEEIPLFILHQLLQQPEDKDLRMALPIGTKLLSVTVSDGLCTVDLSEDFVRNRPQTHAGARIAVFSVVNSLTELPFVERVRFLCAGQEITSYAGLDMTQIFYREAGAFGKTEGQKQTADVNLFLPCINQTLLAEIPAVIARTEGKTLAADVLGKLFSFDAANLYDNPIPDGTMLMGLVIENGMCHVTLSSTFAMCDSDPVQAQKAVRSVAATLCALDDVEQVLLEVHNGEMESVDISKPLVPHTSWFIS